MVDHGERSRNDDLIAFINDQDEEDEILADYCSEDSENSDEENHDSDSFMIIMSICVKLFLFIISLFLFHYNSIKLHKIIQLWYSFEFKISFSLII